MRSYPRLVHVVQQELAVLGYKDGVIARICTRQASGQLRVLTGAEAQQAHLRLTDNELVWVDVVDPRDADIKWLRDTFSFHRVALEDVSRRHQRPKLDHYTDYVFGVLYAASIQPREARVTTAELQFFWGPTYLVTIHGQPLSEIEDIAERARSGTLAPVVNSAADLQVPDLVYHLLDAIVDSYFPTVDALAEWTDAIEDEMFSGQPRPRTLQRIFGIRKNLIELRKVMAPSREMFNALLRRDTTTLIPDEFYPYFQDVYDHTVRVIDSLDTYRDLLSSSVDTYLSIISNDVNQTVKRMTAVTAILMVDALIASIYGMNFRYIPELDWQYGYVWALGLMAAFSVALWITFRRIQWL